VGSVVVDELPKYVVTAITTKVTSIAMTSTAPTSVVRFVPRRYSTT
jgi:hypothetical protein